MSLTAQLSAHSSSFARSTKTSERAVAQYRAKLAGTSERRYVMAVSRAGRVAILLGQCVPCVKKDASKIRVKQLELDKNLLMYFRKDSYVYAHDPQKVCKTGDVVLVQELPEKLTTLISHKVLRVVYPLGDITDPITGKKVVGSRFREDIEEVNKLYGEEETRFKYDDAPERGWQEDKKDFTHRESYIKYHEFPDDDQPYAV
ncbi:Uncharacterized protein GBIM_02580 [Gryllus bimaculatus]|nr:Uncharacterized protein GBIM_02580 [Gryllus bimaculatus]